MFLEILGYGGSVSVPLAHLFDSASGVSATLGFAVPAVVTPDLGRLGLFDHGTAERIAKAIFEPSGPTLTGQWMDRVGPYSHLYPKGVSVGNHRIAGHHFLTDQIRVISDPDLRVIDFYGHLPTDVVTKAGLPLLPEEFTGAIAHSLDLPLGEVHSWLSLNVLEVAGSALAVAHAARNVTSVISGTAEWSAGYAVDTFGGGALELAAGAASSGTGAGPFLIGSGVANIACGVATAVDYYTQPMLCGVPVDTILASAEVGVGISAVLATFDLFMGRGGGITKRLPGLGARVLTSGALSALSAIASPLSITAGLGVSGVRMALNAAKRTDRLVCELDPAGAFSFLLDEALVRRHLGEDMLKKLDSYVRRST